MLSLLVLFLLNDGFISMKDSSKQSLSETSNNLCLLENLADVHMPPSSPLLENKADSEYALAYLSAQ